MKILLICSGGMSTSILITSLEKEALKNKIEDFSALAIGISELESTLDETYNLVLVAPQVRYKFDQVCQIAQAKGIKTYQILPTEYTSIGAANLMKSILKVGE